MTQSYIGLGSNLGNSIKNMEYALREIGRFARILVVSSFYRTKPWGLTEQPDFINAVASIETDLTAEQLLSALLGVERGMGRERLAKWGPRQIDLDILTFGDGKFENEALTIPHPHMYKRAFVLVPLVEIDRNFEPALQKLSQEDIAGTEKLKFEVGIA